MTFPSPAAVRAHKLCKSYPEGNSRRTIFQDLDFHLDRGERVALVGRSGAGKSTLLNLLAGLDRPDGGSIEIGGVAIEKLTEKESSLFRRRHVGFIFQSFQLLPTLTVEENVKLPLELLGVKTFEAVAATLEAVGMAHLRQAMPDRLSGGEQQRVSIARAVVHRPTLILADEPTGSLDDENCQIVLELMNRLVKETGCALLLATHSSEVAAQADRCLSLGHGHLQQHQAVL